MYSVRANAHPSITRYLKDSRIASIDFDEYQGSYVCDDGLRRGLKKGLERMYFPHFVYKTRKSKKRRIRKGSNAEEGSAVDEALADYIATRALPRECGMAMAIIMHLEDGLGHTLEAAQLPLFVPLGPRDERITQADLITSDLDGRLWMWEVKCGYNRVQKQGNLKRLSNVPNRYHEHWELQRHYTHLGLVKSGLKDLYKSHVMNIFIEDDQYGIQKRPIPKWCNDQLPSI